MRNIIGRIVYELMQHLPSKWLIEEIYYGNGTLHVRDRLLGGLLWCIARWTMRG